MEQPETEFFDVVIVGGGAMGLSSAYWCAKAGKKVLVLEQFDFFNDRFSSKGESRFFRIMYSDVMLSRLAQSALPLWQQLEQEAEETLLQQTGVLFYGIEGKVDTPEGNLTKSEQVMDLLGIPYEKYNSQQLQSRFPVLKNIHPEYVGLYQETGGVILAHTALEAFYNLAQKHGTSFHSRETLVNILPYQSDGLVEIGTDKGTYRANKVILAPGAWANSVLSHLSLHLKLKIWNMVIAYYQVEESQWDYPLWFYFGEPKKQDRSLYYGFPPLHASGQIKVGADFTNQIDNAPNPYQPEPDPKILELMNQFMAENFHGVKEQPLRAETCLFTMTVDENFVLDFVPGHQNMILFTGASGQAFKFTPIIGKILSQLAIAGETEYNLAEFSISRPGILA